MHILDDASRRVPELAIAVDLLVEAWIHSLVSGVCDLREETTRVQLELNLQIDELQLKAQPSTPLKIKEQHTSTIAVGLEEIGGTVCDYTNILE